MTEEPILILCDIIKTQLNLPDIVNTDPQTTFSLPIIARVYPYNQEFIIPTTSGVFIPIEFISSIPYSTTKQVTALIGGGMQEELTTYNKEEYAINIMSADTSARKRKEQILLALKSTYSLQQQELYQFQIASVQSNITDASMIEAAKRLNRYIVNVTLLTWYSQVNEITYYDTFVDPTIITFP